MTSTTRSLLEITGLYTTGTILSGISYLLYTNRTVNLPRVATFALINPLVWTGLSVLFAGGGIYYTLLPNRDTSLALAACLATFPSALLSHWAARD